MKQAGNAVQQTPVHTDERFQMKARADSQHKGTEQKQHHSLR